MKRLVPILTLIAGMLLVAAGIWTAQLAHAQDGEGDDQHAGPAGDEFAPARGAAVYAEFCQACHGPEGRGYATGGPAFTPIDFDAETAHDAIASGLDSNDQDGVAMPPYAQLENGPLTAQQIDDVIAYMATWDTGDTPPLPEPNIDVPEDKLTDYFGVGDPQAGATVYATFCYGCHGEQGKGRVPPNFPALVISGDVLRVVSAASQGHENVYMPAFGQAVGGPLGEQQLDDLEAYLASWETEESEAGQKADAKGLDKLLIVMGAGGILLVGWTVLSRPSEEEIGDS